MVTQQSQAALDAGGHDPGAMAASKNPQVGSAMTGGQPGGAQSS
jgi:hypothetical protein